MWFTTGCLLFSNSISHQLPKSVHLKLHNDSLWHSSNTISPPPNNKTVFNEVVDGLTGSTSVWLNGQKHRVIYCLSKRGSRNVCLISRPIPEHLGNCSMTNQWREVYLHLAKHKPPLEPREGVGWGWGLAIVVTPSLYLRVLPLHVLSSVNKPYLTPVFVGCWECCQGPW